MNMTKIANLAGCSLSTVSKAFRNSPEISEETRERIFEIAKQHDCFTKFYAPVFQKRVFAVICPELSSSVYSDMVESLNKKISDNSDMLLISCTKFISSALDNLLDYYINFHKVDGIILIDCSTKHQTEILKKIPIVEIGSLYKEKNNNCDCVNTDRKYGICQAVSHLKEMGHTKIAFIGEYLTSETLQNFKDAMNKCKLKINNDWIVTSPKRKGEAGYDAMEKLISLQSRPTAVFAAYDALAFGAMNCVYDNGLRIPDDFSVIGFDNINLSQYAASPLTTVSIPTEELIDAALNLLYRRLEHRESPYQSVLIQSSLILRNSVQKIL